MSDFVTRSNDHHSDPRHRLLGIGMTVLVATMTVICFVTEVKAACEAEISALLASNRYLSETGTICGGTQHLSAQQTAACSQYNKSMEESRKCTEREIPKEEEAKRAAKAAANRAHAKQYEALQNQQSQSIQSSHDFTDAVKIGMTAAQVDASEKEAFHNPAGWGRTVNTTVTANGTTEQWVYRFSQLSGAHDVYLYFQNGVLTAIQK